MHAHHRLHLTREQWLALPLTARISCAENAPSNGADSVIEDLGKQASERLLKTNPTQACCPLQARAQLAISVSNKGPRSAPK